MSQMLQCNVIRFERLETVVRKGKIWSDNITCYIIYSSGSTNSVCAWREGCVSGGLASKHEFYAVVFGGHVFLALFLAEDREDAHWPQWIRCCF